MSISPTRIRAIVVAVLVLAFVIPWTYAHIAYAWPWKEKWLFIIEGVGGV